MPEASDLVRPASRRRPLNIVNCLRKTSKTGEFISQVSDYQFIKAVLHGTSRSIGQVSCFVLGRPRLQTRGGQVS
jgi:hypothetical protein